MQSRSATLACVDPAQVQASDHEQQTGSDCSEEPRDFQIQFVSDLI